MRRSHRLQVCTMTLRSYMVSLAAHETRLVAVFAVLCTLLLGRTAIPRCPMRWCLGLPPRFGVGPHVLALRLIALRFPEASLLVVVSDIGG